VIEAYERCAAAEAEPDVLQQAWNVCRDLRDRKLPMSPAHQEIFRAAFVRVRDGIIAARNAGWTPLRRRSRSRPCSSRRIGLSGLPILSFDDIAVPEREDLPAGSCSPCS